MQNQNQSQLKNNEQNSQHQNQQQNKPRKNQNWNNQKRNNNSNNRQNNNNRNDNNKNGKRNNNNWQNGRNYQNNRNDQSSQRHCSLCNKFGHTIAECWFRPQNRQPPQLPYQQFSNYPPQPSFSQPQMTTPMMPLYNPMTQPWSPYYDANMAQNQKKLGKPHITLLFLPHLILQLFPLLMFHPQSLALHFSQYLLILLFLLKLLLIQAHFVALCL